MSSGISFSTPPSSSGLSDALTDTHIFVGNSSNIATDVPLTLSPSGGAFQLANTGVLTMPNADAITRGLLTASDWSTFNGKLGNSLNDGHIFVGNSSNIATDVPFTLNPLAGSFQLASNGALTMPNANNATRGLLTASDWNTFNGKQNPITLTTIGTSGAATFIGNTLNIPNYTSGGAVNWSESFSAATQATSQWTPNNAAASVNAAITPKGNGALVAQIPNGAVSGGNARGTKAVDWQFDRSASNQVASAQFSVISGGSGNQNNGYAGFIGGGEVNKITQGSRGVIVGGVRNEITSSSNDNFVGGGDTNKITGLSLSAIVGGEFNTITQARNFIGGGGLNSLNGSYSAICAGQQNVSYAGWAFVGSGLNNNAGQDYASVVGGRDNLANANYSAVLGGYKSLTSLYGQQAYAAGQFAAQGDAQAHELVWRREVTGTAITELFLDGASIAAILPAGNTLWQGTIEIAAICSLVGNGTTTLGDAQGTTYKATIKRLGAATTLVGTIQEIGTTNADPTALGIFTIDANNTNESLRIQFTPPPSAGSTTKHRVVAVFKGLQITY